MEDVMENDCALCGNVPRFAEEAEARVCAPCVVLLGYDQKKIDRIAALTRDADTLRAEVARLTRELEEAHHHRDALLAALARIMDALHVFDGPAPHDGPCLLDAVDVTIGDIMNTYDELDAKERGRRELLDELARYAEDVTAEPPMLERFEVNMVRRGVTAALATARTRALEEAAEVCRAASDELLGRVDMLPEQGMAQHCANRILALKEPAR